MGMKVETPKKPKITTESAIVTVCVDLSKSTFHVVGLDAGGNKILRKKFNRESFRDWLARPVRTRMPGGVAGVRLDRLLCRFRCSPWRSRSRRGRRPRTFRREPQEFPEEGRKATSGTWLSSCHKSVMHSVDPLGQPRNTPITRVGDTHTS